MKSDCRYETTDFYLSAYLRAKGFRIVDVSRDGRRTIFIFEDQSERKDLVRAYYNNEGAVNPLDYQDAIRNLKALIHNY